MFAAVVLKQSVADAHRGVLEAWKKLRTLMETGRHGSRRFVA